MDEKLVAQITELVTQAIKSQQSETDTLQVPIGISARHVHLCPKVLARLFGEGYSLRVKKTLMGDEFAAEECVTLVGPDGKCLSGVRVLGPVRERTQVEISLTDARALKVKAPIKDSGKLSQAAPITLVGPKGAVRLEEACMVARRHIHMPTEVALLHGIADNSIVSVDIATARGGVLKDVLVRVHPKYRLEMHIDTDEANALSIDCDTMGIVRGRGDGR